jgi:YidC/Oxa1 family membrane protein insertase
MSPRARRIVIPLIVLAVAAFVVLARFFAPSGGQPTPAPAASSAKDPPAIAESQKPPSSATDQPDSSAGDAPGAVANAPSTQAFEPPASSLPPLEGLVAVAPSGSPTAQSLDALGSFDWRTDRMKVEFAGDGAGIERITFSDIWQTAASRRLAEEVKRKILANEATLDELPGEQRYVLQRPQRVVDYSATPAREFSIPPFAARSVSIDGQDVALFGDVWSALGPGDFVTEIRDAEQKPVLRIRRTYSLRPNGYDITLRQSIDNLTERPLNVQLVHYGPYELEQDRSIVETRRLRFGYLLDQQRDPSQSHVLAHDGDLLLPHGDVVKSIRRLEDQQQRPELWPNRVSTGNGYRLSWFAWNNRYFAIAAYPAQPSPDAVSDFTLDDSIERIQGVVEESQEGVITSLFSVPMLIKPGASASVDLGIYAGPLDSDVLEDIEPYGSLNLSALILYQMAGCCSFCTFQWLAHGLIWFLETIHNYLTFDWAAAIIILVIIVRALLHPITKKSQINMMRFSKQMQAMQPEMKKIQEKYKGDAKRLQQEQMKLWRERGVNPVTGALGCLPMFLQMPIWIALYAMLYFAFELRHQPAFWGVFQKIVPGWTFLSDLSAPDQFLPLGPLSFTVPLLGFHVDSINVLPLLLGVVFFIQQKYMTPPPSPSMTEEQIQQQKIMKVMMVVLFPLMMYTVPSGLTLYIVTSSIIGILESRYVRRHIDQLDLEGPAKPGGSAPPKKPRDPLARAYAAAMERARERAEARRQGPAKSFKKRR